MKFLAEVTRQFTYLVEIDAMNEKGANDKILENLERLKKDTAKVSETINVTFLEAKG